MTGSTDDSTLIFVDSDDIGTRVDIFLRGRFPTASRALLKREFAAGNVRVNGRIARKGEILMAGDKVDAGDLRVERSDAIKLDPEGPLEVLHKDDRIVAVNKEAGLPTLPRDETDNHALACRLAARYPELQKIGPTREAGLLHRLDTGTSGVIVAARTAQAYENLRKEWKWRRVDKEYIALVVGRVEQSFTTLHPIAHHPKNPAKMVISPDGRSAESRIKPLFFGHRWSLIAVSLREGRRHQIRVHLAHAGFPISGDPIYYGDKKPKGMKRIMLHAMMIRLPGAKRGDSVTVVCEPPDEFVATIRKRLGERGVTALAKLVLFRREAG